MFWLPQNWDADSVGSRGFIWAFRFLSCPLPAPYHGRGCIALLWALRALGTLYLQSISGYLRDLPATSWGLERSFRQVFYAHTHTTLPSYLCNKDNLHYLQLNLESSFPRFRSHLDGINKARWGSGGGGCPVIFLNWLELWQTATVPRCWAKTRAMQSTQGSEFSWQLAPFLVVPQVLPCCFLWAVTPHLLWAISTNRTWGNSTSGPTWAESPLMCSPPREPERLCKAHDTAMWLWVWGWRKGKRWTLWKQKQGIHCAEVKCAKFIPARWAATHFPLKTEVPPLWQTMNFSGT